MNRSFFLPLIFLLVSVSSGFSQTDTVRAETDTAVQLLDSATIGSYAALASHHSFLEKNHTLVINDVQQFRSGKKSSYVFVLLLLLLAAATYVKVVFGKELEELLQSVVNRNLAQQIFRTQSGEISFADVLLHVNFVVTASLYVRFFLIEYFHATSLESLSAVFFLIFLFTFFYLAKIGSVLFIGNIFEQQNLCKEYVYHFSTICKTSGLTLLPALFVFYTAPVKYFNIIFGITILFSALLVLIFVWRALSTAFKLLYTSAYHFFIYVCVVEISSMFLFFKLLTKTII